MAVRKEIQLIGRKFNFAVPLGFGVPVKTQGGAVIEEQARAQGTSLSVYAGNTLVKLDVPVLFDSYRGGRADQRNRIDQIEKLARGQNGNPPPNFIAKGPIPYSGWRFLMEPPEWSSDPTPIIDDNGHILRQGLILKLVQYVDPDQLRFRRRRQRFGVGDTIRSPGSISLPRAESLVQVAARLYDDPSEAKRLGKLNGIHDIRKKLPKGTQLRIHGGDGED